MRYRSPQEMAEPVSRTFPALPSALYEVRKFIREEAERADLSASTVNDVVLAVSEACANAVLHSGSTEMDVSWRREGDCVEMSVRDRGTFVRRVPVPELGRVSGHGIPLMMALMDEVGVIEGTERRPGTTVRLVRCGGR
jgi:anti-sigma regulatory factor (Ser/Thr protein kinase)